MRIVSAALQDLHRTPYLCTLNIYYRYDVSYSMYLMSLGLSWEVAPRRAAICNGALHLELRSFELWNRLGPSGAQTDVIRVRRSMDSPGLRFWFRNKINAVAERVETGSPQPTGGVSSRLSCHVHESIYF